MDGSFLSYGTYMRWKKSNRMGYCDANMASEITPPSPTVPRLIGKIRPDDDRIRVVGTVKRVNEDGSFLLEDKSGAIQIIPSDNAVSLFSKPIKVGIVLRTCGTVEVSLEGGHILRSDILQDFSGIDLELYYKVRNVVDFEVVKL
ncbi:MAG: hypothetical protein RBG13Loki_2993 [Promethearchaeota archaeon CR_4]|nr:MAG: hypothetical protein RBG13Loki_2993 [Candidatus Lokiarchaeota archaeon CR_4]